MDGYQTNYEGLDKYTQNIQEAQKQADALRNSIKALGILSTQFGFKDFQITTDYTRGADVMVYVVTNEDIEDEKGFIKSAASTLGAVYLRDAGNKKNRHDYSFTVTVKKI